MAPRSASCSCASNVHLYIHKLGSLATRSIHASLSCYQGVLRPGLPSGEDSPCSSGCSNGQNASKKAKPLGSRSKQTSKSQETFPPSKISNERQQLSWFTSFATVENTPRKHPLNSDCTSKTALMKVMLISVLIWSDWCLVSVLFRLLTFYSEVNDLTITCWQAVDSGLSFPTIYIYV